MSLTERETEVVKYSDGENIPVKNDSHNARTLSIIQLSLAFFTVFCLIAALADVLFLSIEFDIIPYVSIFGFFTSVFGLVFSLIIRKKCYYVYHKIWTSGFVIFLISAVGYAVVAVLMAILMIVLGQFIMNALFDLFESLKGF